MVAFKRAIHGLNFLGAGLPLATTVFVDLHEPFSFCVNLSTPLA